MRRIATAAVVLAALSAAGCQSMQTPWSSPARTRAVETTKGHEPIIEGEPAGVSDAVMLGNQGQPGFGDSLSGP